MWPSHKVQQLPNNYIANHNLTTLYQDITVRYGHCITSGGGGVGEGGRGASTAPLIGILGLIRFIGHSMTYLVHVLWSSRQHAHWLCVMCNCSDPVQILREVLDENHSNIHFDSNCLAPWWSWILLMVLPKEWPLWERSTWNVACAKHIQMCTAAVGKEFRA